MTVGGMGFIPERLLMMMMIHAGSGFGCSQKLKQSSLCCSKHQGSDNRDRELPQQKVKLSTLQTQVAAITEQLCVSASLYCFCSLLVTGVYTLCPSTCVWQLGDDDECLAPLGQQLEGAAAAASPHCTLGSSSSSSSSSGHPTQCCIEAAALGLTANMLRGGQGCWWGANQGKGSLHFCPGGSEAAVCTRCSDKLQQVWS